MKNNIISIFIVLAALMMSSCEDLLDVNTDPLVATSANANLLFPEVLVNLSNNRTVEVSLGSGTIAQHYEGAFGVFGDAALGVVSTFTSGNTWANHYTTGLKNLVLVEREAAAAEPQNNNVIAQSKILQGFIFYNLTSLWEDIPFSEALGDVNEPVSDSQESILRGIAAMMDEAVGLLDKSDGAPVVDAGDLLYNGDVNNWERFANSLKLKCLMLLANKDASVGSQIDALMSQPLITSIETEAEFKYYDAPGDYNPIWATLNNFAGGANPEWIMGSTTLQDILENSNDPRLSTYYDESDEAEKVGTGAFAPGAAPGSFGEFADHSIVSFNIIRPDAPDRYITSAEIVLMQAEAVAKGLASGGMTRADELYREGMNLSMAYYAGKPGQIDPVEIEGYIASLPALSSLAADEAIQAIQLQIYITMFLRTPEAWTQWRRTKVPDLVLPRGSSLGDIMRRWPYPPDEKGANPNTPADKPLDTPMWFEN